jgi:hypothetical protein
MATNDGRPWRCSEDLGVVPKTFAFANERRWLLTRRAEQRNFAS